MTLETGPNHTAPAKDALGKQADDVVARLVELLARQTVRERLAEVEQDADPEPPDAQIHES